VERSTLSANRGSPLPSAQPRNRGKLLQDGLKITLITLISPAALPSLFPPDTKRAKRLRRAMRAVYTFLESVL